MGLTRGNKLPVLNDEVAAVTSLNGLSRTHDGSKSKSNEKQKKQREVKRWTPDKASMGVRNKKEESR
jgi:hypothetical protein